MKNFKWGDRITAEEARELYKERHTNAEQDLNYLHAIICREAESGKSNSVTHQFQAAATREKINTVIQDLVGNHGFVVNEEKVETPKGHEVKITIYW